MPDPTYANPSALVSTDWISEHLHDPSVRIKEVIWGSRVTYRLLAYAVGHIPGVVAWDYEADCQEAQGNVIDRGVFDQADIRFDLE